MDKNTSTTLGLLLISLISLVFSLSYISRLIFWQRQTFQSNGQSIDENMRRGMSITYHSRNGMIVLEVFLLIYLLLSITLLGINKRVGNRPVQKVLAAGLLGVYVMLVLFSCLQFVGSGDEGYWMTESTNFRRQSSTVTGNTKQRLDEFNTFFKNIPVVVLSAGLFGLPSVYGLYMARLKE